MTDAERRKKKREKKRLKLRLRGRVIWHGSQGTVLNKINPTRQWLDGTKKTKAEKKSAKRATIARTFQLRAEL